MRVLLFLRLPELRLGRGRLGWEAAGWSPRPFAGLMKSPGRLAQSKGRLAQSPGRALESLIWSSQSPGRVPKSLGRLRLRRSWSHLQELLCRLLGLLSRIRLLQG